MNCLREVRTQLGISKWKLAQMSGLNWKTIHRIESGIHVPFEKSKEKIARALGVQVEDIFPAKEVSHIFLVDSVKKEATSQKTCHITGYLLDKNLRRCAGVGVRLTDGKKSLYRTKSREDGSFEFEQVPEGIYKVISKSAQKDVNI